LHWQYFQNTQFSHVEASKHPISIPGQNAFYVWINILMSFSMLVAADGIIGVYRIVADRSSDGLASSEEEVQDYEQDEKKVSYALFTVCWCMLLLQLMEPALRNRIFVPFLDLYRKGLVLVREGCRCCTPTPASGIGGGGGGAAGTTENDDRDSSTRAGTGAGGRAGGGEGSERGSGVELRATSSSIGSSIGNGSFRFSDISDANGLKPDALAAYAKLGRSRFHKRIMYIKVLSSFGHLVSFNVHYATHFVAWNALVAIVPNLLDVMVQVYDFRMKKMFIKKQLEDLDLLYRMTLSPMSMSMSANGDGGGPFAHPPRELKLVATG
jgi:hypothetical protein